MQTRLGVAFLSLFLTAIPQSQVSVLAESRIAAGWMAGGWGSYRFTFRNGSDEPAKITRWAVRWIAKGQPVGQPWGGALDLTVTKGKETVKDEIGYLPPEVAAAASPDAPIMRGTFTVVQGGRTSDEPFEIRIPEARLKGRLKMIRGKTLGLELMEGRFATWKNQKAALRWLDQSYQAMIDLTGYHPYEGKLMVIREAPEHPWWAYAGNPVVMNTKFVGDQLADIDQGLMPFGWVHEVGHNFDVHGPWYIWNGPAAEWQANFKLAYAFETIPDQTFRVRWSKFGGAAYPARHAEERKTGPQFVESFFLMLGDQYLADPARGWETLSSDEMHSFFQRLQRVYGWAPFKAWYRTYPRLAAAGKKPPETSEGKINLIAAILSKEIGVDLMPAFQRWRMPVTPDSIAAARRESGL